MGRKINVNFLFIFVFLALSLIFYYPVLFGRVPFNGNLLVSLWPPLNFLKWSEFPAGIPFKFMGIDEVREFYPLLDFTYDSFRRSSIPLWNPYNFSGYSHIGNLASAVFYPLHISVFLLNKTWVLIFLKLSAIILSGTFTYLYLRTLKLSEKSSYFGAFAFSLGATMQIWNIEIWQSAHAFLWLPLALLSIEKLIRENKSQFILILGFSIAMSIMAGYIQPTIYLLIVSFLYAFFRIFTEKKKDLQKLLKILSGFILGFSLAAIQLIPAIEAYLLSPRSQLTLHDLNISFLLPPISSIVTLLAPDIYGNIVTQNWFVFNRPGQYYENMIYVGGITLLIASLSVFLKKYRSYKLFFVLTALISLSLTLNLPSSRLIYDLRIPFLSSAIPIRVIFVFSFAVSVLAAMGFEWWLNERSKLKVILGILPLSVMFLGTCLLILFAISQRMQYPGLPSNWFYISARNLIIPGLFLSLSILSLLLGQFVLKLKNYFGLILILLLLASSFLFTQKYISFSDKKFLYPSHPLIEFIKENQGLYRYWGYGSAALPNNFSTVYKIYSPEGYDPVNISYYNELLSSSRKGEYEGAFSRSDALLYAVTEFPFKDVNDPRYRIMDILGIKYIGFEKGELAKIEQARLDPARYQKVWEKNNFIVFENKKVFPRVYFTDRFVLRTDKEAAIQAIFDKNVNLSTTVIVDKNLPLTEDKSHGKAKILSYGQNKITIETETQDQRILVLTDSFYPGWKATINGVNAEVIRVNHAFRGVMVLKGKNAVIFSYQPYSFYAGILISIMAIFFAVFTYTRNRKNVN